jgi:hypothetical protein
MPPPLPSFGYWSPYLLEPSLLKGWWCADDYGTLMTDDGGGLISSWTDRMSKIAATGATTDRPTWSASSWPGGQAGVTFDGAATRLFTLSFAALGYLAWDGWSSAAANPLPANHPWKYTVP